MEQESDTEMKSEVSHRRVIVVLAALLATAGLSIAVVTWWRAPLAGGRSLVVTGSPYRNTLRGVKYVGDAACSRCHPSVAETYRHHPMGRSLVPITATAAPGGDGAGDRPLFEAHGLQYSSETRDGRVFHQESRRNSSGQLIARNEAEVQFAMGSGRQAVAYLIERDGFLFESPITWYARAQKWDLSPGYEKSNVHFDRPIQPDCLFCHANRVQPVSGTVNKYRPPIFEGHAIGCERCHGPGELHVENRAVTGGRDVTIVNPAALEPSLRDAVCEQCHLTGLRRVVRLDREAEEFRPGLPFFEFWTALVLASREDDHRAVGQVEQMHESRCFRASQGRLGCISCHDPHELPAPEERVSYYRERCLECHADRRCSLPAAVRLEQNRDNDCTACHMPRSKSSDVLHVAMTNHQINRHASSQNRSPIPASDLFDRRRPMVIFHRALMDERQRAAADRDIGVALCRDGSEGATTALPLLEAALAARPDDLAALEAKAFALGQLGRGDEAMAAFRSVLAKQPERETALTGAAYLSARGRKTDDAIAFWQRDIALNPWRSEYHADLAVLLFQNRDWRHAALACREALRLNPSNQEVRKLLVRCELRLQDRDAAQREFQVLLAFDPPDRDELIRWYTPLTQTP
jgi:tetratricopeptide (TPR) repeat protein